MEDELFALSAKFLNRLQINPFQQRTKARNAFVAYIACQMLTVSALMVMAAVDHPDFDIIVEVCNISSATYQAFSKLILFCINASELRELCTTFSTMKRHRNVATHRSSADLYAQVFRAIKLLDVLIIGAVLAMITKTLIAGTNELPFPMWLPTGLVLGEPLSLHYVAYFAIMVYSAVIVAVIICGCDGFYMALVTHLAGQLAIVNEEYRGLYDDKGRWKEVLGGLVQRQNVLFICLEKIEKIYSKTLLFQLASQACMNCMCLYTLSVNGLTMQSALALFMMQAAILQSFLYCAFGQLLSHKFSETPFAIYESNWYENYGANRDLRFLLMNAHREKRLTYGGLINLDFITFSELMRRSFSFYALLQAQNEENK